MSILVFIAAISSILFPIIVLLLFVGNCYRINLEKLQTFKVICRFHFGKDGWHRRYLIRRKYWAFFWVALDAYEPSYPTSVDAVKDIKRRFKKVPHIILKTLDVVAKTTIVKP